jgi:hypothetical protein
VDFGAPAAPVVAAVDQGMKMPGNVDATPFRIGSLIVRRVPSSAAEYRAYHQHYWRGYLCPGKPPKEEIGTVSKLIEVRSLQELKSERDVYRAELDPFAEVQFTYYEVIDARDD